jgi:PAS domain-containing protein
MTAIDHSAATSHRRSLPLDVYVSLVDSLYGEAKSLFIGTFAAIMTTLLAAWRAGEPVIYLFALAIPLVTVARAIHIRAYNRARGTITDHAAARRWELEYVAGAALYVALLGGFCVAVFVVSEDPFLRLFAFSITLAYLIGTPGRNFASDTLVVAQIICSAIPLTLALVIAGDIYAAIFAFVLLPFFLSLRFISKRLRGTLLDRVLAARDVQVLANRFDTALNNMPHGLAMVDAEQKIVVANARLAQMLCVRPISVAKGVSIHELL